MVAMDEAYSSSVPHSEVQAARTALKLSAEEIEVCQSSFDFFDSDGDGKISPSDIGAFLRALTDGDTDEAETLTMISDLKQSAGCAGQSDGCISFLEYATHWQTKQKVEVTNVFDLIDLDKDGVISKADIERFVTTWGGTYAVMMCSQTGQSAEDISGEVIQLGGDGKSTQINYAQFAKLMTQTELRASRASRSSRASRGSMSSRRLVA
ncbi:hypothetical protein M885DRAFT_517814 [Pelagophyceae sp. CCMP2097]|nr:hypothetical protein M885DRAFT_517814 [Pelagophyceae sp. CCMP2097]|mmetsp:Transcript_8684/g.28573  ORF Transcript_8684/g.28573 Transcript_8684/m.28573 type:complete len:209 (+) Transcript_8684:53-679(+)